MGTGLLAALLAAGTAVGVAAAQPAPSVVGTWQLTGAMSTGHAPAAGSTVVKLRDGRVLAATGAAVGGLTPVAELYDPATGQWTPTGPVHSPRWGFSNVVALPDGRVLITGGHDQFVNDYASTELYDPATGAWTFSGSLTMPRRHTVVVGLDDGRVLAATGALGAPDGNRFLNSAEIYNPATGTWTPTGSAPLRRESADGVRLRDGRVMVVGGYTCCDSFPAETDLYNPSTGTWSRAGDRPHGGGGMALASLPDGRILSVGGGYGNGGPSTSAEAALFDPSTGLWTATTPPQFARSGADAVVLPDGKVLVAGGGPAESELFDPATTTWSAGPNLNAPRVNGQQIVLDNGAVLMAAGYAADGPTTVTELYTVAATPVDTTTPVIAPIITGTGGAAGWYTSDVDVSWSVVDDETPVTSTSGCGPATVTVDTTGTTFTCTATSSGGTATGSATVKRDATPPVLTIAGGPAEGGIHEFGSVPAAATCTAADATSGPTTPSCTASGYSAAVGSHVVSFAATDIAGNTARVTRSYTVRPWTLIGFRPPVDMGGIVNVVKGGSTVPLKFEVFAGPTELTDTTVIGATFAVTSTSCTGGPVDDVEFTSTGGTALRYDAVAGQFIQNWKTPKNPGACYTVSLTTADGTGLSALFRLK